MQARRGAAREMNLARSEDMGRTTVRHRSLGVAMVAIAAMTTACCKRNIPPPDNAIEDPVLLKAAIDARVEQFEAARFKEVVLDYYGAEDRIKVRQLILVKPPSSLFVQTRIPGSDEVLNRLVSNGEVFSMHHRDTNEYLTGRPTRANINQLLPLNLSAADVVRVMLGGAPWDRAASEGNPLQLEWDRRRGRYRLWVERRQGGALEMAVRHTDFAVVALTERDASGELVYEYTTDDWRRYGTLSLPDFRRFVWPSEELDFSVDVGETQVNVDLPDTLFVFPPPPGSQVIEVDDNGLRR